MPAAGGRIESGSAARRVVELIKHEEVAYSGSEAPAVGGTPGPEGEQGSPDGGLHVPEGGDV